MNIEQKLEFGQQLRNMSSEKLDRTAFEEYLEDYANNAESYAIHDATSYYKAIMWAVDNVSEAYEFYCRFIK
jgi:hypothetical protein